MYLSRLTFHTLPGKTQEVEERLMMLRQWVEQAGGANARVMRTHFGSSGAPDLVFEQEVTDPGTLENQIRAVSAKDDFQQWARQVSGLLAPGTTNVVMTADFDKISATGALMPTIPAFRVCKRLAFNEACVFEMRDQSQSLGRLKIVAH